MIEIVRDAFDSETRQARHDWAEVTGTTIELAPTNLRHLTMAQDFCSIAGAIGYPAGEHPGCMIIVGVNRSGEIHTLEYQEQRSIYNLIAVAVETRNRYGFGKHKAILPTWTGDPDRYQSVVTAVSVTLEEKLGEGMGFYLRPPVDWTERHAFPLYMWQMRDALGKKRLKIHHPDLISRVQAIQPDVVDKGKVQDLPAAGMLGALAHTIITERPWEQDIDHDKPTNLEI